ncbi:hypothetical protein HZH66_004229 [Vespula vulgaris]|uniref:Uncharacterized protein n=1 Tax=Vespula vulgaris TaxID=7454 RepID=A0A834KEP6_VESVU|nr:hypothetical protein HZH66_004229 [Vespula vulgaris]
MAALQYPEAQWAHIAAVVHLRSYRIEHRTTIEFQRYNTIYLKTVDGNITKFRAFRNFPTSFVDITFSRPGDYVSIYHLRLTLFG